MGKNMSVERALQLIAYIGTALIAIALMLVTIFKGNGTVSQACSQVGQAIAYIITMIAAGSWVRSRKHIAWLICYIVFVVAIIVLYVLGIVLW